MRLLLELLLAVSLTCTPTACTVTWERAPGGVAQVSVSYEDGPGCLITTRAASGRCVLPSRPGEEIAVVLRAPLDEHGAAAAWQRTTVRPRYVVWLPVVSRRG